VRPGHPVSQAPRPACAVVLWCGADRTGGEGENLLGEPRQGADDGLHAGGSSEGALEVRAVQSESRVELGWWMRTGCRRADATGCEGAEGDREAAPQGGRGSSLDAQAALGVFHLRGEEYACQTKLVLARGEVKLS